MTSSPARPSTWLSLVRAATTPSRPRAAVLSDIPCSFRVLVLLVSCPRSSLAFGRRCIPPGCVAPPRRISLIRLRRRALPGGRSAVLGATTNFWDRTLASAPLVLRGGGEGWTPAPFLLRGRGPGRLVIRSRGVCLRRRVQRFDDRRVALVDHAALHLERRGQLAPLLSQLAIDELELLDLLERRAPGVDPL